MSNILKNIIDLVKLYSYSSNFTNTKYIVSRNGASCEFLPQLFSNSNDIRIEFIDENLSSIEYFKNYKSFLIFFTQFVEQNEQAYMLSKNSNLYNQIYLYLCGVSDNCIIEDYNLHIINHKFIINKIYCCKINDAFYKSSIKVCIYKNDKIIFNEFIKNYDEFEYKINKITNNNE
jgi:hypothetical protein